MAGWGIVKVALLSDCYLPRLGGIEVQVHDLARQLQRAGHDVEVFTATGDRSRPATRAPQVEDGIRVNRFDLGLPGGIPIHPFVTGEVARRLRGGGFEVAHVHMGVVSPFAVDMARVAQQAGVPLAVTWHSVLAGSAPVHRVLGYAGRWARRGAALSAVSAMAAARVQAILPEGTPVGVLPNGIDVARWSPPAGGGTTRDERGGTFGGGREVRVVAAQRFVRRKRPHVLLEVLAAAREALPAQVRLTACIVGDGPQRAVLARRLRSQGRTWITLPGRVSRERLQELHGSSDIYLSAAVLESFGIAALEARTAGLAVVARAETGADDFISNGREGLLATDDAGLAAAVARLAMDRELLTAIRSHNATTAPAQNWPAVVALTVAEYERAIAQRTSR